MKHAIVMGASSGIGFEVAKLLLENGWKLGLAARRTEPMEEMRKTYPDLVTVVRIDVTADDADTTHRDDGRSAVIPACFGYWEKELAARINR